MKKKENVKQYSGLYGFNNKIIENNLMINYNRNAKKEESTAMSAAIILGGILLALLVTGLIVVPIMLVVSLGFHPAFYSITIVGVVAFCSLAAVPQSTVPSLNYNEKDKDIIASILKEKEVKTLEGFKKHMQFSVNDNTINKNFKSLLVETIKEKIPDYFNSNNSNVNDKMKAVFAYNMAKFFREKEHYEYFFNTILKDAIIKYNSADTNKPKNDLIKSLTKPNNKLLEYQDNFNVIEAILSGSTPDVKNKIVDDAARYFEKQNPAFKLDELQKIYDYASAIQSITKNENSETQVALISTEKQYSDFQPDLKNAIDRKIVKKIATAQENNTTFSVSEDCDIMSAFYSKILAKGQEIIARKPQNAIPTAREKSEAAVKDMITAKFARMIIKQRAGMYDKPAEVTV